MLGYCYAYRVSFYGVLFDDVLPFNFWRSVHILTPMVWAGMSRTSLFGAFGLLGIGLIYFYLRHVFLSTSRRRPRRI
jgi:nitric oxide reductase large subunit